MDYEKKYKEALEKAQQAVDKGYVSQNFVDDIFPELKESEDERMSKEIIDFLGLPHPQFVGKRDHEKWIAWLEKQGNKSVNIDVESMVSSYEQRLKSQGGTKNNPLVNMCLTAFRHGVENVLEELNLKKLEKQGEKKPADKTKFKVGNWYQCIKDFFGKGVTFDKNTAYYCAKEGCLKNEYGCHIAIVKDLFDNFKLWTIQDAKDGDVLVAKDGHPFIFTGEFDAQDDNPTAYCGINSSDKFIIGKGSHWTFKDGIKPATKEQRDLLFQKMKEAGYEWDADKKELKKIEVASKESEDERIRKSLINFLKSPFVNENITDEKVAPWIAWLEKQGEFDDNIITRNDEILQAISVGLTDVAEDVGWSDFGGIPIEEIQDWLDKQGDSKETDEEWEVSTGLYKCTKRMFDGSPEGRLLFEVGNLYKCITKNDIAEFESSYGHNVFLIDPMVRKHFIKV